MLEKSPKRTSIQPVEKVSVKAHQQREMQRVLTNE